MAGFALIFARDGAPVSESRLAGLAHRMAYRGTGVATWTQGPIALAQIGARTHASPPVVTASADGRWRMVFDGRLDNRAELSRALSAGSVAADGSDDAQLAMLACDRWGADAPRRMIGDFAAAAWNAGERNVWLLRDVRAIKPLFYRLTTRELTCASDLRTLAMDAPVEFNEGMVAECLSGQPASHRETLYQGIQRLPMAHMAVIGAASARESHYWVPQIPEDVAGLAEEARTERLTALLDEAVEGRLAGASPAALLLSGGLDSSSIAALLSDRAGLPWRCFTVGHARRADDEREYAALVADHLKAPHTIVESRVVQPEDLIAAVRSTLDLPPPPNGVHGNQLREQVSRQGFTVAFSGVGGDEWFSGSPLSYADLARQGSFVGLARAVWADRHRNESTRLRVQLAVWALCPPGAKKVIRTILQRTPVPGWVSAGFAARTSLADRLRTSDIPTPDFPRLSQRAFYEDVTCGEYVGLLEMQERGNALVGVEERYPFHDRRVSEFCLALPESDLWGLGWYKVILRRAMAARLPPAVLERQTSPNANLVLADMLLALGGESFFNQLEIAKRGWVDQPYVRALWRRAEQQSQRGIVGRDHWALWSVAAMELWARHAAPAAASGHRQQYSALGGQSRVS